MHNTVDSSSVAVSLTSQFHLVSLPLLKLSHDVDLFRLVFVVGMLEHPNDAASRQELAHDTVRDR
jgi:hypothetical protein